jgi:hypothetical protein
LQEILKRPLYQRWQLRQDRDAAEQSSLIKHIQDRVGRMQKWLSDWLARFSRGRHAGGGHAGGSTGGLSTFFWVIAWVVLGLFVVAVIFLIVRIVRGSRMAVVAGNVLSREQVADALTKGNALALAGEQWLDEASRLAAERNFRAMYRALYLALLSGLHSQGKIDFNRHQTNWVYVSRYRGATGERKIFSRLTELFDNVWYGQKDGDGRDLDSLQREVLELIASKEGAPAALNGGEAAR